MKNICMISSCKIKEDIDKNKFIIDLNYKLKIKSVLSFNKYYKIN